MSVQWVLQSVSSEAGFIEKGFGGGICKEGMSIWCINTGKEFQVLSASWTKEELGLLD